MITREVYRAEVSKQERTIADVAIIMRIAGPPITVMRAAEATAPNKTITVGN